MSRFDTVYRTHLAKIAQRQELRSLRPVVPAASGHLWRDGRLMLNFSSNDSLGLSQHPALILRACAWTEHYGVGAGASRLVTGCLDRHVAVESRVAALKGTEAALLFASGWQANAALLSALLDRTVLGAEPLVFADRLIHASLYQGCQAAGVAPIRFRHNDLEHLETLLRRHAHKPGRRFIVSESVFSMDGDRADVAGLAAVAERWDAFFYLDEAHATGVLGPGGMGLSGEAPGRVDLVMGTFSKALGCFGAYAALSARLRDYLVNTCSGFIYTTALPPPVLGAMDAALELLPALEQERMALMRQASRVRSAWRSVGLNTGASSTHIIPLQVGAAETALAFSARLEAAGILGVAIRPPTVPPGTSRLRFSLSAAHQPDAIDRLIQAVNLLAPALREAAQENGAGEAGEVEK